LSCRGPRRQRPSQSLSGPSQTSVPGCPASRTSNPLTRLWCLAQHHRLWCRGPHRAEAHRSRYQVHRRPVAWISAITRTNPLTQLWTVSSRSPAPQVVVPRSSSTGHRSRYPVHRRPRCLVVLHHIAPQSVAVVDGFFLQHRLCAGSSSTAHRSRYQVHRRPQCHPFACLIAHA
jgi:hypothetical protein